MDVFSELRQLLLDQEQARIDALEKRIVDLQQRSETIAEVLPAALKVIPNLDELVTALQQPVDSCVQNSLNTQPQRFADSVLPLLKEPLQSPLQQRLDQQAQENQKHTTALLKRIKAIEAGLSDSERRVHELANALPKAIRQASTTSKPKAQEEHEAELTDSLKGPVQRCLRQSISEDTKQLADTLFPIMGPAIRKSINESIKGLLQEINVKLEQSPLSPRGIAWRLEAMRKGVPLQEVVLRNTLLYRVEQVFLIHRESGLLMQHLHRADVEVGDSDAVSGMLTAIQDFVQDSFSADKEQQLDNVEVGQYTVWLERGPYAILACVIRGNPPYKFRSLMHDVQETLHARYSDELENFDGDSTTLEPAVPLLQRTLQIEVKDADKPKRIFTPALLVFFGVLLLLGVGWFAWASYSKYLDYVHHQRLMAYVETLHNTVGITPVSAVYRDGTVYIHGFRDPLAISPRSLIQEHHLQSKHVADQWTPYQDVTPLLVEKRVKQLLVPPDDVSLQLQGTTLTVRGTAPQAWIKRALTAAEQIAGVDKVIATDLHDPAAERFDALLERLAVTPGIVLVNYNATDEGFYLYGLRDPLAVDPAQWAAEAQLKVDMHWQPYHDLAPEFVLARAKTWLQPPKTVEVALNAATLKLSGSADYAWQQHALASAGKIAGVDQVDVSHLEISDAIWQSSAPTFAALVARLQNTAGIVVVEHGREGDAWVVRGLRDPLAVEPDSIASAFELPKLVMHWQPYQDLTPEFVLARAKTWLQPPETVEVALDMTTLKLSGSAPQMWINQAQNSVGKIAGVDNLDFTALADDDAHWALTEPLFIELHETLDNTPGIVVLDSGRTNGMRFIKGLRDPLAADPEAIAQRLQMGNVRMSWQAYHDLSAELVLQRAQQWLKPPETVSLKLAGDVLQLSGEADYTWIQRADASQGQIAGVQRIDSRNVMPTDAHQRQTDVLFAPVLSTLQQTDGLVVIEHGWQDGKRSIQGLRDPLAPNPEQLVAQLWLEPLEMDWQPYQDLSPTFVVQRATDWLQPPPTVTLSLDNTTLYFSGEADQVWIDHAHGSRGKIAGVTQLDMSQLHNRDAYWQDTAATFKQLLTKLEASDGLVVTDHGRDVEQWFIHGLRDPLAAQPETLAAEFNLAKLRMQWQPYQALTPSFIFQRAKQWLRPPDTVQLRLDAATLRLTGHAPRIWIDRAMTLPGNVTGVDALDTTNLVDADAYWAQTRPQFEQLLVALNAASGLVVTAHGHDAQYWFVHGLRDPLAVQPQTLAGENGLTEVAMDWQPYQALEPEFVLARVKRSLQPPAGVTLDLQGDQLVISGVATHAWRERASHAAGQFAGVDTVDVSDLQSSDDFWLQTEPLFQTLLNTLHNTPGLVVLNSGIRDGKRFVQGLRDPLAADPNTVINRLWWLPLEQDWQLYQDHAPTFRFQRLRQMLQAPPSVELQFDNDTLHVKGKAPQAWLDKLSNLESYLDVTVDTSQLQDQDELRRQIIIKRINQTLVYFDHKIDIREGQEQTLRNLVADLTLLLALDKGRFKPFRLEMSGETDGLGGRLDNQNLSLERANIIRNWLHRQGIPKNRMVIMPPTMLRYGATQPEYSLRLVRFKVVY